MMRSRMLSSLLCWALSSAVWVVRSGVLGVSGIGLLLGSQAQLIQNALTRVIVAEYALDGLAERGGVAQRTLQGHQRITQLHQLAQLRYLIDQVRRVEILHGIDVEADRQVFAFGVILKSIGHVEAEAQLLLGQHFVEIVLVDGNRLAVLDLALVLTLGEIAQHHQLQGQLQFLLGAAGIRAESDIDAFLGCYRAFFGHVHSPFRYGPRACSSTTSKSRWHNR